jgi:hypothetical protein
LQTAMPLRKSKIAVIDDDPPDFFVKPPSRRKATAC